MGLLKITLLSLIVIIIVFSIIFVSQGWSGVLGTLPSLVTGGLGVAIASAILNELSKDRERRAEFVKSQLQDLYGPLKFLIDWSTRLHSHASNILEAYNAEYVEQKYSQNPATQQILREYTSQTLKAANRYVQRARENNEDMIRILRDNYHLLEADDVGPVSQFLLDYTRLKVEWGESGLEIPKEVLDHLGSLTDLRPEFVETVNTRFAQKQSEWKTLIRQR